MLSHQARPLLRSLALAAVAICTLSGCFTLQMDLQIRANDTVDGSIVLAFDEQVAEQAGGENALLEALAEGEAAVFADPPSEGGVETREYRDGRRVGVEYVLSGVPIADFSTGAGNRESVVREFTIQRVGDSFIVDGKVSAGAILNVEEGGSTAEALQAADLSISVTFPGAVQEANGRVNGSTVTWTPPVGNVFEIRAVGDAGDGTASALLVGLVLGLCLVAGLIALAVIASRRFSRSGVGRG